MWQRVLTFDVVTDEDPVGHVDEEEHDEGPEGRSGLGNNATPEINFIIVFFQDIIPQDRSFYILKKLNEYDKTL